MKKLGLVGLWKLTREKIGMLFRSRPESVKEGKRKKETDKLFSVPLFRLDAGGIPNESLGRFSDALKDGVGKKRRVRHPKG